MAQYERYQLNLEAIRNDTLDIDISFTDESGVNIPASTFTSGRCFLRKYRSGDTILEFNTSDSSMVITDGNININKAASNTNIAAGVYKYDIELTMATGDVITPIYGKLVFIDDITY